MTGEQFSWRKSLTSERNYKVTYIHVKISCRKILPVILLPIIIEISCTVVQIDLISI